MVEAAIVHIAEDNLLIGAFRAAITRTITSEFVLLKK